MSFNIDKLDRKNLLALVLGTAMIAVASAKPKKPTRSELLAKCHEVGDAYAPPERVESVFDDVMEMGVFVLLGDEVSMSERGALMFDINAKKMAIADVTGDPVVEDLDKEQIRKIRAASEDVPG